MEDQLVASNDSMFEDETAASGADAENGTIVSDGEAEAVAFQQQLIQNLSEKQQPWREFNWVHQSTMKKLILCLEDNPKDLYKPKFDENMKEISDWTADVAMDLARLADRLAAAAVKMKDCQLVESSIVPVLHNRGEELSEKLAKIYGKLD